MKKQVRDAVEKRIKKIDCQEEFDEAMNTYLTSSSPDKTEAIHMLKKAHPLFDKGEKAIHAEAMSQIINSEADISDLGGN